MVHRVVAEGVATGGSPFVAGTPTLMSARARLDGYRTWLETAGLPFDPELVVAGDFDYASGARAADRLLALDDPPTAVFAADDQMALGVYEGVRRRGMRVPQDLSVVGFDDLPQARWSSPLTTVHQPLVRMGMPAARSVLRMVDGETIDVRRVELSTRLVLRDSTAPDHLRSTDPVPS